MTAANQPGESPEAPPDCPLCPRLAAFRRDNRRRFPDFFNNPVPSFGTEQARLLIVGLAPGLKGANRTGRPFTGDYSGALLYDTLIACGFAEGRYDARPDDSLRLRDARIANAVRCVPPENKPTGEEVATCRRFLEATLDGMPRLEAIVALGRIAHDAVLDAYGLRKSAHPFAHGAVHALGGRPTLFDTYHCSRQNTNTGRLTSAMFRAVFEAVRAQLGGAEATGWAESQPTTSSAFRSGGNTG